MIMDKSLLFSDGQAVTVTDLCTNSVDLWAGNTSMPYFPGRGTTGQPIMDPARGTDVEVLAQVTTAFGSNSATVQMQLVMADDLALSTNLTVVNETAAIADTALVAGYRFRLRAPKQGLTKRFLGVKYIVTTGAITGKITAGIVEELSAPSTN
jgi:hypothetical protein